MQALCQWVEAPGQVARSGKRTLVAKTYPVAIFRRKKKQKCWEQATVEVRGEAETGIRVKPGFRQQGVLAGPKDVVVCVVR